MLLEKLKGYNVILASHSPRRRELLSAMGIEFTLSDGYEVEEVCPEGVEPELQAIFLSKKKSGAYNAPMGDRDIVITADTLVILDDIIMGKPRDRAEAIQYIKLLSGKSHKVITGVTLRYKDTFQTFSETTTVTFAQLSDLEIEYYIDNYKPYDKAGAYAVQEWIGVIGVTEIEGTYFNIMGLPTTTLYKQFLLFLDKIESN